MSDLCGLLAGLCFLYHPDKLGSVMLGIFGNGFEHIRDKGEYHIFVYTVLCGAELSNRNFAVLRTGILSNMLEEKLKEVVKNLTIKCVQLTEQGKKLTTKVDGQQKQISRLTDKVMEQSDTVGRLQEKASDLGRLERHLGREQVQSIVERSKALEQAERANKRPKRAFEMSR